MFGPLIHDVPTPSALNDSTAIMYTIVEQNENSEKILDMVTSLRTGNCWVDVRDVGEAHVLALEKESVANERIIISAGSFVWQEWSKSLNCFSFLYCIDDNSSLRHKSSDLVNHCGVVSIKD